MKGYVSNWDKAMKYAKAHFGFLNDEAAILRVAKQHMAKLVVGPETTIGKNMNTGTIYLEKRSKAIKPRLP